MKRIGIMGGTFDPIHNGHLMLGEQAYQEYQLDEVWYMPAKQPPHKKTRFVTAAKHRCNMVKLALEDHPGLRLSDFELHRNGISYTAQTVLSLKEQYPDHQFYFIIGADSLFELEQWYQPEVILRTVYLLVADRPYQHKSMLIEPKINYYKEKYQARIGVLHSGLVDISSSDIRKERAQNHSISAYVPAKVEEYMMAHKLYQEVSL